MQKYSANLYLRIIAMILTIAILNSCTELPLFAAIGYALENETIAAADEVPLEDETSEETTDYSSSIIETEEDAGQEPDEEEEPSEDETTEETPDYPSNSIEAEEDAGQEPDEEEGLEPLELSDLAASSPYTITAGDMSAYNTYSMADALSYAASHSASSIYILKVNMSVTDYSSVILPADKTLRLILGSYKDISGVNITVEGTLELMGEATGAQGYVNIKNAEITVAPGGTLLWEGGSMSAAGFENSRLTIADKTNSKPAGYARFGAADSSSYLSFVDSPIVNYGTLDIQGNPSKADAMVAIIGKSGAGTITNYGTLNYGNARTDVIDQYGGTLTVSFREQFGARSPWIGTLNLFDGNTIISDGVFGTLTGAHGTKAAAENGAFKTDCSELLRLNPGYSLYLVDGYYRILEENILAQRPDGMRNSFASFDAASDYLMNTGGTITLTKAYQTFAADSFTVSSGMTVTLDAGGYTMNLINTGFNVNGTLNLRDSSGTSNGTFEGSGAIVIESGVYSRMNFQVPASITGGTFEDAPVLCSGSSITDGRFKSIEGLDEYLSADRVFLKESDGYYHVRQTTQNYKATLPTQTYYAATVAEAIELAGKLSPDARELHLELLMNLEESDILIPKGYTIHLNLKDKALYGNTVQVAGSLELTSEQKSQSQNLNYNSTLLSGSMTLNAGSGSIITAADDNIDIKAGGVLTLTGIQAPHIIKLGYLVNDGTIVVGQADVHPSTRAISIDTLENSGKLVLFDSYVRHMLLLNGSDTEIRMPAAYVPDANCRVDSIFFQAGNLNIYGGDFGPITYENGVSFACYGGTFESDPTSHLTQDSLPVFYDGICYIVCNPLGTVDTSNATRHPFDTLDAAAAVINGTTSSQYILNFLKSGSVAGNAAINAGKRVAVEIPQNAEMDFSGSLTVNGSIEFGYETGKLKNLKLGGTGTAAIFGGTWENLTIQSSNLLVSISDGTFDGALTVAENAKLTITGGSYAQVDGLSQYLPEGKQFQKQSDGYYRIVDSQKNILINADNQAWFYENLADAAEAALANGWEKPVFTVLGTYTETTDATLAAGLKGAVLELGSFVILGEFTLTSECPLEIRGGHMPGSTVIAKDGLTVSSNMAGVHTLELERGSGSKLTGDFYAEKLTVGAWVVESEISGGTYNDCIFLSKPEGLTITGGKFNTDPTDHCTIPENKHFVKNGSYYELADHERLSAVINGKTQTFFTLDAAMAAIIADTTANAHTLTVLDDYTVDKAVTIPADEHLTYALNGFTTNLAGNASGLFLVEGTLELIGEGTIYHSDSTETILEVSGSLKLLGSGMLNGSIVLSDGASIYSAKDASFEVSASEYALIPVGTLTASEILGGTFVGGISPVKLTQRNEDLVIQGGIFSADISNLLPDAYSMVKIQQNPERWQVRYEPVIIVETGKHYLDLKSAAAELADGQTIRLLDSLALSWEEGNLTFGDNINSMILDLNDRTITGALTFRGTDVTVKNGTITPAGGASITAWGLNLTMEKVQSTADKLVSFYGNVGGEMNTVTLTECSGVSLDAQNGHVVISSGSYSGSIDLSRTGSSTITGGSFGGDVQLNEAAVSGGEFAGTVTLAGISTISGGQFHGDIHFTGTGTVENGQFWGQLSYTQALTLNGGRYYYDADFSWSALRDCLDANHTVRYVSGQEGYWEIIPGTVTNAVAKLIKSDSTAQNFDSPVTALAMARDGETVVLLEDHTTELPLHITRNRLTLLLDSKTLTYTGREEAGIVIGSGLTNVLIANGTVDAYDTDGILIQKESKVELDLTVLSKQTAVRNKGSELFFRGGYYSGTANALHSVSGHVSTASGNIITLITTLVSMSDFACFEKSRTKAYDSVGLSYDESDTKWSVDGHEMDQNEKESLLKAYGKYVAAAIQQDTVSFSNSAIVRFQSLGTAIALEGGSLELNDAWVFGRTCFSYSRSAGSSGDQLQDTPLPHLPLEASGTVFSSTGTTFQLGSDTAVSIQNSIVSSNSNVVNMHGDNIHFNMNLANVSSSGFSNNSGDNNHVNLSHCNIDASANDASFASGSTQASEINVSDCITMISSLGNGVAEIIIEGGSIGATATTLSGIFTKFLTCFAVIGAIGIIAGLMKNAIVNGRHRNSDDPDPDPKDRYHYQVQIMGTIPKGAKTLNEAFSYAVGGEAIIYLTEKSWAEEGNAVNPSGANTHLRLNGGKLAMNSGSIINQGRLVVEGAGEYIAASNAPVIRSDGVVKAEADVDFIDDPELMFDLVFASHLGMSPTIRNFTDQFAINTGVKTKVEHGLIYGMYLQHSADVLVTGGEFKKINYVQSELIKAGCSVFQMQGSVLRITGGVFEGALDFSGFPMIINYLLHPRNVMDYTGGNTYIGGGEFHDVVNGVILNRDIVANSSESNILVAIKDGLKSAFIDHEPIQEVIEGHVKLGEGSYFNGISLAPRMQVECDGTKFGPGTYLISGYFTGAVALWQKTGYVPLFFLPYDILDCLENPVSYSPKTNDHPEGLIFHRSPGVATIFTDVSFRESLIAAMNFPSLPAFFPSDNNWDVYTQYVLDTLTLTRNYYPDPIPLEMKILQINEHLLVHLQLQHGEEIINPLYCPQYDDFMTDFKQLIIDRDVQLEQIAAIIANHVKSGKWVWMEAKDSPFSDCYSVSVGDYDGGISDHHEAATELLATLPYSARATNSVTLAAKGVLPDGSRFVRWTTNYGVECFKEATLHDPKNDIYYVNYTPERQNTSSKQTQENEFIAVYETPTAKIQREETIYYFSLQDALTDMKSGEEVILLKNVTLSEGIELSKDGTIHLGEYKITIEGDSPVGLQVNANVKLIGQLEKSGGLKAAENAKMSTLIAVGSKSSLTIMDASVDASGISSAITVQGGTVIVPPLAYTFISGRDSDIHIDPASTGVVELSSGYYHHPVPEAFCAPGYQPKNEPIQDWYSVVKKALHPLALYSALNTGESYSLAKLEGGGRYAEGEEVAIKAGSVMGMRFTGWYECTVTTNYLGERRIIPGTLVSADPEAAVTMKDELWNLVAVYERVSTGLINLTVISQGTDSTGTVTVNGELQEEQQQIYSLPLGTVMTLTTSAPTFKAWLNSSNHIVGTQKTYRFTLVSDAVITMDANSGSETIFGYAYVEFVSGYGQIMKSERWDYAGKAYQLPPVPDKLGGLNGRWSVDGKTAATVEDILNAVRAAELHYIQVRPIYDRAEETHTITVYEDGIRRPEPITLVLGNATTVTAAQIPGKTFSYWAADPEGIQILGYTRGYYLVATKDVTLYAIYDAPAEPEPVMVVSNFYALEDEPKLKIETTRTVPSGFEMLEHGILRTREEALGTPEKLLMDTQGVTKHVANTTAPNGVYTLTIKLSEASRSARYYVRGYLIVKNRSTGEIKTIYSDIHTGMYNEMVTP